MAHADACPDIDTPRTRPTRIIYSPSPARAVVEKPACVDLISAATAGPLTASEEIELHECEAVIHADIGAVFRVGDALKRIRDGRLYRHAGATFDEYVKRTFDLGRAHAYRLIEAGGIKMSPIGRQITNERQARAIAAVPESERAEVIETVLKSGGMVTAQAIKAAAKASVERSDIPEAVELDLVGREIPKSLLPLWHRCEEIARDRQRTITEMKSAFRAADEADDVAFAEVQMSALVAKLTEMHSAMNRVKPHAVCKHVEWGIRGQRRRNSLKLVRRRRPFNRSRAPNSRSTPTRCQTTKT